MSAAPSMAADAKSPGNRAIRSVEAVSSGSATGLVASVYGQVAREFAIVPPITIHSVVPEILAGMWCLTREAFIVGRAGRARREMVAAAVSRTNECPYCVEVHSAMLHATSDHGQAPIGMDCRADRRRNSFCSIDEDRHFICGRTQRGNRDDEAGDTGNGRLREQRAAKG